MEAILTSQSFWVLFTTRAIALQASFKALTRSLQTCKLRRGSVLIKFKLYLSCRIILEVFTGRTVATTMLLTVQTIHFSSLQRMAAWMSREGHTMTGARWLQGPLMTLDNTRLRWHFHKILQMRTMAFISLTEVYLTQSAMTLRSQSILAQSVDSLMSMQWVTLSTGSESQILHRAVTASKTPPIHAGMIRL